MHLDNDLRTFSFAEIVRRCQQETTRYFQKRLPDNRYCFELFRLALVEQHQEAWHALYDQYRPLVLSWLQRGNRLAQVEESGEALINETFVKFWGAMSPTKFATFLSLGALLDYLQACAGSVILDWLRRKKRLELGELEADLPNHAAERSDEELHRQELVAQIDARLKDDDERLIFFAMFTLGMTPREICDEWGDRFGTVRRVNQIRQNIVERLRRDESLRHYYDG